MVTVEGTKFISEVEFDQVVSKRLLEATEELLQGDRVKGLLFGLLLGTQMSLLRQDLFGLEEGSDGEL